MSYKTNIIKAASLIKCADSLIITAGAGMGVDSGLPDFRGKEGFWNAYPALGDLDVSFSDIANPYYFKESPEVAWGFYGHRLNLYRDTVPHIGFEILKNIGESKPHGYFVYTSNVDGQFQKAGFEKSRIVEKHGSIHHLQCIRPCGETIYDASKLELEIDERHCRLVSDLPRCENCGEILRPNIFMFDDWGWIQERYYQQNLKYKEWALLKEQPVIIEIGAGTDIPSIRYHSKSYNIPFIRINPIEDQNSDLAINIKGKALDVLIDIERQLLKNEGIAHNYKILTKDKN